MFTIIWVVGTLFVLVFFINKISSWEKSSELSNNRRYIDQMPSVLSTIGVLGTFIGITMGLIAFDTSNIDASIPHLLDGLKTAFFTSLAGMGCSLILQHVISLKLDKNEKASDISIAARKIVTAVEAMQMALNEQAVKQDANQANFYKTAGNLLQSIVTDLSNNLIATQAVSSEITNLKSSIASDLQNTIKTGIDNLNDQTTKCIDGINRVIEAIIRNVDNTTKILDASKSIDTNVAEVLDVTSGMVSVQDEMHEEVKNVGVKLHSEVVDIVEQMQSTNALLSSKFDEFSELLKKSNTEALVDVMRKVTEEFQKQMNDLISRLVQENFSKLNESVQQLNSWQVENKEMIQRLTSQYSKMATDFEGTSTTLSLVGNNTKALVSDGSKLNQIVNSLNQVMVQDAKFKEISSNLISATESSKTATKAFEDSTVSLNEWVKKQRNFVEGVTLLIQKLEDLDKIRSYSEDFWKETRDGMHEGVSIISDGSKQLSKQLKELDTTFYSRLSATLASLDDCIAAMMKHYYKN